VQGWVVVIDAMGKQGPCQGHAQGNGGGGQGIKQGQFTALAVTTAGATVTVGCVGVGSAVGLYWSSTGGASMGVREAGSAGTGVLGKSRFNNDEVANVSLMIMVAERKVPFWNVFELDVVVVVGNPSSAGGGDAVVGTSGLKQGAGKGHGTENGAGGHGTRHGQCNAVTELHIRAQIKITIVRFYR